MSHYNKTMHLQHVFLQRNKIRWEKCEGHVGITMTSIWWLTQRKWTGLPNCCCDSETRVQESAPYFSPTKQKQLDRNVDNESGSFWGWQQVFRVFSGRQKTKPPNQVGGSMLWTGNAEGPGQTRGSTALGTMISIWKGKLFNSCGATCLKDTLN